MGVRLLALVLLAAFPGSAAADAKLDGKRIHLTPIAHLDPVTNIASAPGDRRRLYVVERRGVIRVLVDGRLQAQPLADLSAEIEPTIGYSQNEHGMASMAFAPDFQRSRRFYVFYSDRDGNARVAELRDRPGASPRGRTLLTLRHDFSDMHYGGQVAVGPGGMLYVSFGDAADGYRAQRPGFYGKIVRLDPRRPRKTATIVAMGLRNPFRFSFTPGGHRLAIADVGDADFDEVDLLDLRHLPARGYANFGWPYFEGPERKHSHHLANYVPPVLPVAHPRVTALIGGVVVRDPRLPALDGRYFMGDFGAGWVGTARLGARRPRLRMEGPRVPLLTTFGEDQRRRVYVGTHKGDVYRVDPAGAG